MLTIIVIIFAIAAMFGGYLASYVLLNKPTPKAIAFIHGPLAALGLILLAIVVFTKYFSLLGLLSVIFFALAAVGGFILIIRDLTGRTIPKWLVLIHGSAAVLGLLFLLLIILR